MGSNPVEVRRFFFRLLKGFLDEDIRRYFYTSIFLSSLCYLASATRSTIRFNCTYYHDQLSLNSNGCLHAVWPCSCGASVYSFDVQIKPKVIAPSSLLSQLPEWSIRGNLYSLAILLVEILFLTSATSSSLLSYFFCLVFIYVLGICNFPLQGKWRHVNHFTPIQNTPQCYNIKYFTNYHKKCFG